MIINKIKNFIIAFGFFTLISLPIISLFVNFTPHHKLNEKRKLAKIPKPSLETLFLFPKQFESYFNDNFGFRNFLIRCYTDFKINWLKSSRVSKVVIGKDGWLFFAGDDVINDYRCTKPFSEDRLKSIAATLTERQNWLNDIGIKFLVVIAPNKHTIYPENLPYTIKPIRNKSRFDQLEEYLDKNTDIELIDLRDPLKNAKKIYPTYCNTDTHWTRFGALIATSNIVEKLKVYFPNIQEVNLNNYNIIPQKSSGDLARMINMDNIYIGKNVGASPKKGYKARKVALSFSVPKYLRKTIIRENSDNTLPSALIFRDSFCDALASLLSEHFSKSTYIWNYGFLPEIVETVMPDVVILEVAERFLNVTGIQNPLQVKNQFHKSCDIKQRTSYDNSPVVFETFDFDQPKGWRFTKGQIVSNNTLKFYVSSNSYSVAYIILNQVRSNKKYKISIRLRKNGNSSYGWLFADLFQSGNYDSSKQEILIPVKQISSKWKTFSKTFNSGNSPNLLLFRIGVKSFSSIEIDWVRLDQVN